MQMAYVLKDNEFEGTAPSSSSNVYGKTQFVVQR